MRNNQKGMSDIFIILGLLVFSSGIIIAMIGLTQSRIRTASIRKNSAFDYSIVNSAAETFVQAFKAAERHYIETTSTCDTVKPFIQALKSGSDCNSNVQIFNNSYSDIDPGLNTLYSYPTQGCIIQRTSSNCIDLNRKLLSIGEAETNQKIQNNSFYFNLIDAREDALHAEFKMIKTFSNFSTSYNVVIKNNLFNLVHQDSTYKVVQDNPDPLSKCSNQA